MQARERYRGASTAGFDQVGNRDSSAHSAQQQRVSETFERLLKEQNQPVHAIAHIDLDGFYAAVERRRLSRPTNHPIAVEQWGSLIAVDYNCRPFGVKRGMSSADAVKLCPKLECVHVGLISSQSNPARNNKANSKVSLARYRRASFQVIDIFLKFAKKHGATVQRSSIDESYIDFTSCVENYLRGKTWDELNLQELLGSTHVVGSIDPLCPTDIGLIVASHFVHLLRSQVEQELTFTLSAGIAQNKLLAKVASSRNKPNKQTLIPLRMTPHVLRPLALRGVPGLG
jgi:DNA polymerase eta